MVDSGWIGTYVHTHELMVGKDGKLEEESTLDDTHTYK